MKISYKNQTVFSANLLISGKKELLTEDQISALKEQAHSIGSKEDIVEVNLGSDIFDFSEVREGTNHPKKFLSGYKLSLETTVEGLEHFDASVAKTQQTFFERFAELKPFSVIASVLQNLGDSQKLEEIRTAINDNPQVYNTFNGNWFENSRIKVADTVPKPIYKHFFNSPFYKAMTKPKASVPTVALVDAFDRDSLFIADSVRYDTPHGVLVSALLEEARKSEDFEIERFEVKALKEHPCSFNPKSLLKTLKKVGAKGGFDYLNLSVYYPADYKLNGVAIKPEEIHLYREALLEEAPPTIRNIIAEIEKIAESGTEVYIAGGNRENKFNLLSLAKGAHFVGGVDDSPLKVFSSNSFIETYKRLPVYLGSPREINSGNMVVDYPFERDLARMSKSELKKRIAKKEDYTALETRVNELTENGKYKIDLNFLENKVVTLMDKNSRGKLYDLGEFLRIFEGKFDNDVLTYIHPQGTHCDLQFSQFFDMNSKKNFIIPQTKTTKILKSISGTSFATPQALVEDLRLNSFAQKMVAENRELYKSLLRFI